MAEQSKGRIRSTEPFTWKDKFGYMAGDLGNNMTFMLQSSFLLVFYTEVLGIEGAIAGSVFLVARIVDAFTDVAMGKIADKTPARKEGKFKPWIKWIAGPVALGSFLMYQSAMVNAPMGWRIVYMYVTYLLWGSIFYTAINIPYGSMASAITADPDERTSLSVWRGSAGTLASMIIGVITPMFIYTTDAQGNEIVRGGWVFPAVAGGFAIIAIIFYIICYQWTTERVVIKEQENQTSVFQSLGQVVTNRSLVSVTFASITLLMVMLTITQMSNYIFPFYYGDAAGISITFFIQPILSLLIIYPLSSVFARNYGKKEAGAIGMFIGSVVYFFIFFYRPENMIVYITFATLAYMAMNIFNATVWAAITDVIDDHELQTGQREDGTVYAINSFARKVGQSLAGGLPGIALTLIGYESGATQQAPGVLDNLFNITVLIPAVGFLICGLILTFWYPLSKRRVAENQQLLAEKHANGD